MFPQCASRCLRASSSYIIHNSPANARSPLYSLYLPHICGLVKWILFKPWSTSRRGKMKLFIFLVLTGIVDAAVLRYPQPKGSKICVVEDFQLKVGEILKPVEGPLKCTKLICEEDHKALSAYLESCGAMAFDPNMSLEDKKMMIEEFEKSGAENKPYPLCCRPL